jgi:hypothetical protein
MDQFGRPADIGELYEHYINIVKAEVVRAGVDMVDVEDVCQDLIIKFWQKDFIGKYDPTRLSDTPKGKRRPKFTTLLRVFVRSYVRQDLDKQRNRARREPVRLEAPAFTGENGPVLWMEVVGGEQDIAPAAEIRELMRRVYVRLCRLPVNGRRDLAHVFATMVEHAADRGKIDLRILAKELGVPQTTASEWIGVVRQEMLLEGLAVP